MSSPKYNPWKRGLPPSYLRLIFYHVESGVWWFTPVHPALKRGLRKENGSEFKLQFELQFKILSQDKNKKID